MRLFGNETASRHPSADRCARTSDHAAQRLALSVWTLPAPLRRVFRCFVTQNPGTGCGSTQRLRAPRISGHILEVTEEGGEARKSPLSLPVTAVRGDEAGPPRGARTPGGDGRGGAVTAESSALVSGSSAFLVWGGAGPRPACPCSEGASFSESGRGGARTALDTAVQGCPRPRPRPPLWGTLGDLVHTSYGAATPTVPFPAACPGQIPRVFPFPEAVTLSPPFKTWQRGLELPIGVAERASHSVYLARSGCLRGCLVGGFH